MRRHDTKAQDVRFPWVTRTGVERHLRHLIFEWKLTTVVRSAVLAGIFQLQARLMRKHLDPDAQLVIWLAIFNLCVPLYGVAFFLPGSWLDKLIYWLSVGALHLTAMTGVTAAETLIAAKETDDPDRARTEPESLA